MKDIEKDILQMLADGTRVQTIADMLGCTTTEVHRAKVKYPDYLKQLQGKNLDGTPNLQEKMGAPPEEAPRKHSVAELFQRIEQLETENKALKECKAPPAPHIKPLRKEIPEGYKLNYNFVERRDRRVMVLMQSSLYEQIKELATAESRSVNDIIHLILESTLKGAPE